MSPSSHRETKWTGKLAQDQRFPSKLAPTECRIPLHFQPGIPTNPLLSWRWTGRAAVPDTVASTCAAGAGTGPLCCLMGWHSWPGGHPHPGTLPCWHRHEARLPLELVSQPCHEFRQMVSKPSSISSGCLATTELFRPTQIWLAGVHTLNANILAGAAVS